MQKLFFSIKSNSCEKAENIWVHYSSILPINCDNANAVGVKIEADLAGPLAE